MDAQGLNDSEIHRQREQGPRADILVVDNDDRIVELVAWFLGKRGFRVRRAQDFAEARRELQSARPDLMLSDLDLGLESALEELPRLAAEGLLPGTLVVSGYLDQGSISRLEAIEGVLGTLPKPFDFERLEQRVLECLEAKPARQVAKAAAPAAALPGQGSLRSAGVDGWTVIRPGQP